MAKVTGIGGIFFKSKKDKKTLAEWYEKNLGISLEEWGGALFRWTEDKAEDKGITVWNIVEKDSTIGNPNQDFIINYRVDDLNELISHLKLHNVDIIRGPEYHENGKFAWIIDPEGNTIELWEAKIWHEKNKQA